MKHVKLFEEFKLFETMDINLIKLEKPLELVNTDDVNKIVSLYNKGIMPLDEKKVLSILEKLKNGKELPPLKINKDNLLVDGHHRYMAYKLEKILFVPYERV